MLRHDIRVVRVLEDLARDLSRRNNFYTKDDIQRKIRQ